MLWTMDNVVIIFLESRVLIGSVARYNLETLLNEQMQGVYDHAKEIKHRRL